MKSKIWHSLPLMSDESGCSTGPTIPDESGCLTGPTTGIPDESGCSTGPTTGIPDESCCSTGLAIPDESGPVMPLLPVARCYENTV